MEWIIIGLLVLLNVYQWAAFKTAFKNQDVIAKNQKIITDNQSFITKQQDAILSEIMKLKQNQCR